MEPEFLCFTKESLTRSDVQRNLEIPNGASFLPPGNEVMIVRDQAGTKYEFIASERRGGRRALTWDWHDFAVAKNLQVGDSLRMYWSGNENEYVVQLGTKLFGDHIVWLQE
ncbi:unnamed protein product [Ilex paraguariensis]|uniref:TF-B3 domain-containing protein n=1 Tax=Ilex paraguariensis TaxID=185542 RepID=A0ABC8UGF0_9AQUA